MRTGNPSGSPSSCTQSVRPSLVEIDCTAGAYARPTAGGFGSANGDVEALRGVGLGGLATRRAVAQRRRTPAGRAEHDHHVLADIRLAHFADDASVEAPLETPHPPRRLPGQRHGDKLAALRGDLRRRAGRERPDGRRGSPRRGDEKGGGCEAGEGCPYSHERSISSRGLPGGTPAARG